MTGCEQPVRCRTGTGSTYMLSTGGVCPGNVDSSFPLRRACQGYKQLRLLSRGPPVGGLKVARYLEAMAHLHIQIAVAMNVGTNVAFVYHVS